MNNVFATLLSQARGNAMDEVGAELTKLIEAIDETGKGGELTFTLKIKTDKADEDVRKLSFDIKTKMPKRDRPESVFFTDGEGGLTRKDPKQSEMFDEQTGKPRLRGVSGDMIAG